MNLEIGLLVVAALVVGGGIVFVWQGARNAGRKLEKAQAEAKLRLDRINASIRTELDLMRKREQAKTNGTSIRFTEAE